MSERLVGTVINITPGAGKIPYKYLVQRVDGVQVTLAKWGDPFQYVVGSQIDLPVINTSTAQFVNQYKFDDPTTNQTSPPSKNQYTRGGKPFITNTLTDYLLFLRSVHSVARELEPNSPEARCAMVNTAMIAYNNGNLSAALNNNTQKILSLEAF